MTLEIIVFVGAILLGIVMFWRESKNNSLYRLFNKLLNAKKLQMKATDRKGFIYEQSFIYRLVYVTLFCGLIYGGTTVLTPINIFSFELFTASVVGILGGTYIASAIIFANAKIEDEDDLMESVINKGKEIISDFTEDKEAENMSEEKPKQEHSEPPKEEKSARERLKDKGLL